MRPNSNLTADPVDLQISVISTQESMNRPPSHKQLKTTQKQSKRQFSTPAPNQNRESQLEVQGNAMMQACLKVQYFKNQVYDPTNTLFPKRPLDKFEQDIQTIAEAREDDPKLQNVQEVQRLLENEEKYKKVYNEQMELRKTVEGNKTKYKYTQQLKKTMEQDPYHNLDNNIDGMRFKRDYLTPFDQQYLCGAYVPTNCKKSISAGSCMSKHDKIGKFDVEESRLLHLPKMFKSKEQLYEAVSNQAMVKGIKLKLDLEKKQRAMGDAAKVQFMTEINEGLLPQEPEAEEKSGEEQADLNSSEQK